MGQITAFDLNEYIQKYKIKQYIETGTGEGVSLEYAQKYEFTSLFSIDIDEELYGRATNKFKNDTRITLINDYSTNALKLLIPKLDESPVLFFLDAHFPGADFHKTSYEESIRKYKNDAFPLEDEIKIICELRNFNQDVIVVDDFVLYDKNPNYESIKNGQVWEYEWLQNELEIKTESSFIYELFGNSHNITKDYRHQGYLIITPK